MYLKSCLIETCHSFRNCGCFLKLYQVNSRSLIKSSGTVDSIAGSRTHFLTLSYWPVWHHVSLLPTYSFDLYAHGSLTKHWFIGRLKERHLLTAWIPSEMFTYWEAMELTMTDVFPISVFFFKVWILSLSRNSQLVAFLEIHIIHIGEHIYQILSLTTAVRFFI